IAVAALGREREARRGADASADRAARAAARASTRAAAHQLERVGSARARELIADVEPAYRGWEWRLLDALTDDTLDAVDLPEVAPGATVVVSVDGDGRLRVADPAALGPRPPSAPSEGTPSDDDPGGLTPTTGVVPPDVHVHDAVAGAYVTIGRHRPAPLPFELDGVACRLERVPGGDVIVRREADGVAVRTLAGHKDRVVADARSADGRRLATLSLDRTLRVWDLAEGTSVSLRQNETNPWAIALSPDGAQVVVAGRFNGGVLVRPVARPDDGERLLGAREPVLAVGRSADGRFLVVVGVRKARSFALGARADLDVLARHDAGGRRPVLGVAVDPTGRLLATVGLDQSLRLTDLVTTDAVAVWRTAGMPASVAWDPRGRWLVHAADELVVHDARDGTRLASARPPDADGRASRPARLVVAADGEALFATTVAA
ncbi:MAG: hypothetical protein JNM10_17020, partial [Planctomycetia bacterium]|nr:hypothetical protein [Planctomycetia bacterium]